MLKLIDNVTKALRPQFMNAAPAVTPAACVLAPALAGTPAAGTYVQPREEILLDDLITIPAGATGRVIEAPADFLLADEVVVDWPQVGTIIHKLSALTDPSRVTA